MKRSAIIPFCLLVALLAGCAQEPTPVTLPQTAPTDRDPTSSAPEITLPQTNTETTALSVTEGTEPATTTEEPTQQTTIDPLPTAPPATQGVTQCGHAYQSDFYQPPTCEQAGYQTNRCVKCGDVQQNLSLPLGHSFGNATCTLPKQCERCGCTDGAPLGHQYGNGICIRCGGKDPAIRTVTIQIKDSANAPVDGVTVELYIANTLHSTAVSSGGKAVFTLQNHTGSYQLVLTGIPRGYKARKDRYTYSSDNGAIVLDIVPTVSPEDHSQAAYKVGSTMGDFTVTDVDGKTHQLSKLLQEKKLVILNFWYYTCVPCKAEFPYFNSLYEKYGSDIEILGLNHFDSEAQIRQLQAEMGLKFPLAAEHLGMQQGFGIQSYPMTVFISSTGKILKIQKDIGFQSEGELETLIRQMIGI